MNKIGTPPTPKMLIYLKQMSQLLTEDHPPPLLKMIKNDKK